MRKLAALLAIIAACGGLLAGHCHATPSTLIWIPSTDIQAAGVKHLGIDLYSGSGPDPATDYGLTFGSGKLEYGVDYFEGLDDPLFVNAKLLLKDETPSFPRVVAGVFGLGTDDATSSNVFYLLGSKTFPVGRFTFGYAVGKKKVLGEDNAMLMLGFDKMLNDKWCVLADYQGGKNSLGAFNAGVSYNFTPTTSLIVGYDWYNDSAISDTLTLQLDVNF